MGGAAQLLSDADLLAVVQHIHVVRAKSFSFDKLDDAARAQVADVQAFYATQFTKAGGRRQMAFNKSDTTLALWVFDSPKSWALVTRGPSRAIVVRADGFPDLAVFGRLFRVALSSN